MDRRPLAFTDISMTRLGLGAWAIGGGDWCLGWGPQRDEDSIATIRRAIDRGINWIDTAAVYGLGRSERIIARALRGVAHGARPHVFTTCGFAWDDLGNVARDLTAASIRRQVEASLRRLGVEALDLVQIDAAAGIACRLPLLGGSLGEACRTLADLQAAGLVGAIGALNCSPEQLDELSRLAPLASVQAPYSLLHREAERDLLPYSAAHGLAMLAASPMASGLLTGGLTAERLRLLPHNDWRRTQLCAHDDVLARAHGIVEALRTVGARRGVAAGAVAIAWVLRRGGAAAAIAGARTPRQIDALAPAASLVLDADELRAIDAAHTSRSPAPAAHAR